MISVEFKRIIFLFRNKIYFYSTPPQLQPIAIITSIKKRSLQNHHTKHQYI
jgi:hypothetical protein